MRPVALTVAGSDSSGGAGIQADLKVFHQLGVYGASALALVTAQNSREIMRVELLPPSLLEAQIAAVCGDFAVAAVKTGALGSAPLVEAAVRGLGRCPERPVVVDPVIESSGGVPLLAAEGVAVLRRELLPLADLVTPNLPEAELLLGTELRDPGQWEVGARALRELGAGAVLIKGGHGARGECADLFFDGGVSRWLRSPRHPGRHTHGTGCAYAAAITAYVARGMGLFAAVTRAHAFVARAIAGAPGLGGGAGPIDHWASAPP